MTPTSIKLCAVFGTPLPHLVFPWQPFLTHTSVKVLWIQCRQYVRPSRTFNISSFFWNLAGKIWFVQKWGKSTPNTPKMDPFALYTKLWHNFFQQMPLNDKAWYLLTLGENSTSGKNLVLEMWGKTGVPPNMWYQTSASSRSLVSSCHMINDIWSMTFRTFNALLVRFCVSTTD